MRAEADVSSLRPDPEQTQQWNARLRASVIAYIKAEAEGPGRTQASVVEDAVELDKTINEKLGAQRDRIVAFAAGRGMDMDDLGAVVSALVVVALDCLEKKSRK